MLGNFLEYIHFEKIRANVIMQEIHTLGLVPQEILMTALAYQVSSQKIYITAEYFCICVYKISVVFTRNTNPNFFFFYLYVIGRSKECRSREDVTKLYSNEKSTTNKRSFNVCKKFVGSIWFKYIIKFK